MLVLHKEIYITMLAIVQVVAKEKQMKLISIKEKLKQNRLVLPNLSVFTNTAQNKVFQWQPKGKISFELAKGYRCTEKGHSKKAEVFLNSIIKNDAELAITPEYSFPYSKLKSVFEKNKLQPQIGVLWCFGMEGITGIAFKKFIEKYRQAVNIIADIDVVKNSKFLSAMVYLFLVSGKLTAVFQLKIQAAKDSYANGEMGNLCVDDKLYYFEYKKRDICKSAIVSLICADFINEDAIKEIKKKFADYKLLILNLQLNDKPNNSHFVGNRVQILSSNIDAKIIVANWAISTCIDGKTPIPHGQSSIHYKNTKGSCDDDRYDDKTLLTNFKGGLVFIKEENSFSWNLAFHEGIYSYFITSLEPSDLTKGTKEPICVDFSRHECLLDFEWIKRVCGNGCRICTARECGFLYYERFFASFIYENFENTFFSDRGEHKLLSLKYHYFNEEKEKLPIYYTSSTEKFNPYSGLRHTIGTIIEAINFNQNILPEMYRNNFEWKYDNKTYNMSYTSNRKQVARILFISNGLAVAKQFMEDMINRQGFIDAERYLTCYMESTDTRNELKFYMPNFNENISEPKTFASEESILPTGRDF